MCSNNSVLDQFITDKSVQTLSAWISDVRNNLAVEDANTSGNEDDLHQLHRSYSCYFLKG